ncbi:aliphatic sulfonate ABC transporter substrate-binding protein [Rhizobium halophytocola]|uniref:aliphatic sulfonate ABC transporter substrate-binding protein n=1 Tax=Rhizobium halophytocola TaxID=735519 RepID=UPI00360FC386
MTRRNLMMTTAALAAAGTLPAMRPAQASTDDLSIGYIADFPNASVFAIAEDQKLWDAEGLSPSLKVFTNGPIQIQAMGAGSLNFGTIGPGALWLPASGRAKVIGVNDIGFSDRIIAQSGIKSVEELKGKKVGVPQGTSGDMILRMGLAKAGMTVEDIEMVPMDPSTVVAAFAAKQIDAAGIWYPLIDAIKARVPDLNELVGNKDFFPDTSFINTYVAGNDIVEKNPKLVVSFLKVMKKAMDYRIENLDRSIELTTAFLKAPKEATEKVARSRKMLSSADLNTFNEDGTVEKWLTQFNDMFKTFGTVKDPMPAEQYYTKTLFAEA